MYVYSVFLSGVCVCVCVCVCVYRTADYESLVDLESQIRTQIQSRDRHPLHTGKVRFTIHNMTHDFISITMHFVLLGQCRTCIRPLL